MQVHEIMDNIKLPILVFENFAFLLQYSSDTLRFNWHHSSLEYEPGILCVFPLSLYIPVGRSNEQSAEVSHCISVDFSSNFIL